MQTMPAELLDLIVIFQPLFTKPTWGHVQRLLIGALLARGKRTVTACLRVVGLSQERHFQNYHRVLNRAKWDTLQASKILLGLLIFILPADAPIVVGGDDTVERRRGRKIKGIGCYRDPVASSHKRVVKCFGLKWLSLMVLVPVPWTKRVWGLPFLTVLCRVEQKGQKQKIWRSRRERQRKARKKKSSQSEKQAPALPASTPRQHKTTVDVMMILAKLIHGWHRDRLMILVLDGGYAAGKLALQCASTPNQELVTRLRWNGVLYHPLEAQPAGKSGRKPLKGKPQRSLRQWAACLETPWEEETIEW